MFDAFTGCDTVSPKPLVHSYLFPVDLMYWMNPVLKPLGCIVIQYDKTSLTIKADEARQHIFFSNGLRNGHYSTDPHCTWQQILRAASQRQ